MPAMSRVRMVLPPRLRALAASTAKGDTVSSGALLGAVLLGVIGAMTAGSSVALRLPIAAAHRLDLVGSVDVVLAVLLSQLPWHRLSRRLLLIFPLGLITTAGVAAAGTPAVGATFVSCIGIAVVYIGLTQPPGTTLRTLPVLALAWWPTSSPHDARTFIRLPLAMLVWTLIGELLAGHRQEQQREADRLLSASTTDALTGLGNRRVLDHALDAITTGSLVALLRLDDFKTFNDQRGHEHGDDVLRLFSQVVLGAVGADDTVCRYGGAEFVIILSDAARGMSLLDWLQTTWSEHRQQVTFTGGLAARRDGESGYDTLRRADLALYAANSDGGRIVILDALPTPRRDDDLQTDVMGQTAYSDH
jgi:diguanylate cyclase (GGDEF)-like protein